MRNNVLLSSNEFYDGGQLDDIDSVQMAQPWDSTQLFPETLHAESHLVQSAPYCGNLSYSDDNETIGILSSSTSPSLEASRIHFEQMTYPPEYQQMIGNQWQKQVPDVTVLVPQPLHYQQEQAMIQPAGLTSIGMTQDIMELFHRTFPSGQSRYHMPGRNRFAKLQDTILNRL